MCIPIIDRHDDPGHKDLEFAGCCFQSVEGKEELDKAIVSLIREHTLKLYQVGNEERITARSITTLRYRFPRPILCCMSYRLSLV